MEQTNLYDENSQTIEKIQATLIKARKILLKDKNFSYGEKLSEIEIVIDSLSISLKSADPILVNSSHKSAISSSLTQIDSWLQN
ncbi:MAG: hypothetical protein ABIP06_05085 [Pyrinomonadaceae bacterium]